MKVNKIVTNTDGQCTVAEVIFEPKDKIGNETVDDFLQYSVTLELNQATKIVSYKAHSSGVVASGINYIPKDVTKFSPTQLFNAGWSYIMKAKGFESWQPQMIEELETYIKEATKNKKSFSMKGDTNKAIFVATYLYYLNAIPTAIESRHEEMCNKLNMSSGQLSKNLSRVSVPIEDMQKFSKKNKVNVFTSLDKMTVTDKDVYLMKHSDGNILGGYITQYAQQLVEKQLSHKYQEIGMDYTVALDPNYLMAVVGDSRKVDKK